MLLMSSPPDIVREGVMILGCPVVPFVRPFVRSYILTMISHERHEQFQ